MNTVRTNPSHSRIPQALLAVVVSVALALSLFSYVYFLSASNQIDQVLTDDLRNQNKAEALHISEALTGELRVIATAVFTASDAPLIRSEDVERGEQPINSRQDATDYLTDRYFWIDENGKTLWSSAFINQTQYQLYKGYDVSDRPYFAIPARTQEPYFSPIVQSPIDSSQRMFISYPIFGQDARVNGASGPESSPIFKGVIVASIKADRLYEVIKSKLSTDAQSSPGIIDPNGIIVYSTNKDFIGENVFGEKVQALISQGFSSSQKAEEFNQFLRRSIETDGTESRDFAGKEGPASSITYLPVNVQYPVVDNSATGLEDRVGTRTVHFLTLYLSTPHNIASKIEPLISQQRNQTFGTIVGIGAIAAAISYILIVWNNRLEKLVIKRTADLDAANKSLSLANEQIKRHDIMQTEFINIAAHELRTPVQPLLSIAEELEEELATGSEEVKVSRPEIEMLTRNAKRLSQLTKDVLEVSRIESNSLSLNKQKIDLKEKIRNVIEDSKVVENQKQQNIVFEDSSPGEQFIVEADKSKLYEILSNLLRNAIKFSPRGLITVKLKNKADFAEISVVDTGKGIDKEIFPKLFEKFATKADAGTGLGLYIAKSLVEAHGGKIWGINNPDGNGATFSFTIPMSKNEKAEVRTN